MQTVEPTHQAIINEAVQLELLKRENTELKAKIANLENHKHRMDQLISLVYKIKEMRETMVNIEAIVESAQTGKILKLIEQ